MDKLDLHISPIAIPQLLTCEIEEGMNRHVRAVVSGYVSGQDYEVLDRLYQEEFTIRLEMEDGSEKYLFRGVVEQASIQNEGKVKKLTVKAASHTIKLDTDKRLRVFQDTEKTYQSVTRYITAKYPEKTGVIYVPEAQKGLKELVVQYQETDWEFLKRLGSRLGLGLIADIQNAYPCFYFGLPERRWVELEDPVDYQISCTDTKADRMEISLETGQILDICGNVNFLNRRLRVYKKKLYLTGGALMGHYTLRREEGFYQEPYENGRLIGCSLMGKVKSVREDKIRIWMDCEDIPGSRSKEYPYATVYSSPDGTGWYCMPEEGDRVRLYFPDETEDHGYAASAVHLGAVDEKRKNPEEKSIRTVYDKEVRFTPTQIRITNHKGMWILLDDHKGITIRSKKQIALTALDGISLTSQGAILVEGENGITLQENESMLMLQDGIRQNGLDIQFK